MGRVVVEVVVENHDDVKRANRGEIGMDQVRRVAVEALVDTGTTYLCLPRDLVDSLGLDLIRWKNARTAIGETTLGIYGTARITVQERAITAEIMALPSHKPCLLGQIPLELMDWWVDLKTQKLVGNPAHGGEWVAEI